MGQWSVTVGSATQSGTSAIRCPAARPVWVWLWVRVWVWVLVTDPGSLCTTTRSQFDNLSDRITNCGTHTVQLW